ncbi:hypothetical protein [Burkholderia contaminans]|nr:hypothetical protein [Burkholderia contaminans]
MRIVDEASVARNADFPLMQVKHTGQASAAAQRCETVGRTVRRAHKA